MPKKVATKPQSSILFLSIEFIKSVNSSITFYVLNRPVLCVFACTSITIIYLILSSPKVQQALASLPFERFISQCKSQKMITVYATMMEVGLELLMTVVLAGVSVVLTMWIAFEEMAGGKHSSVSVDDKRSISDTESQNYPVFEPQQTE